MLFDNGLEVRIRSHIIDTMPGQYYNSAQPLDFRACGPESEDIIDILDMNQSRMRDVP